MTMMRLTGPRKLTLCTESARLRDPLCLAPVSQWVYFLAAIGDGWDPSVTPFPLFTL